MVCASNLHTRDEIGRLAGAFNAMLEELAAAREREISDQRSEVPRCKSTRAGFASNNGRDGGLYCT